MPLEKEILTPTTEDAVGHALADFEARHHTGTAILLREERLRNFFTSAPWVNEANRAVIVRAQGDILGSLNWSEVPVFASEGETQIALVHGLRIAATAKAPHVFLHGYSALAELAKASSAVAVYAVVLRDNSAAQRTLVQRLRKSLASQHITSCLTYVLGNGAASENPAGCSLRRAGVDDIETILAFLQAQSQHKANIPRLYARDLIEAESGPRGLTASDFYLAFRGNRLLGLAALWNQQSYRHWSVAGYHPLLAGLRTAFNLCAGVRGQTLLPRPNTAFPCRYISFLCVEGNEGAIARALVQRLQQWSRFEQKNSVVLLACDRRDPLSPVFAPLSSWRFESSLLQFSALRPQQGAGAGDRNVMHFEAGLL